MAHPRHLGHVARVEVQRLRLQGGGRDGQQINVLELVIQEDSVLRLSFPLWHE